MANISLFLIQNDFIQFMRTLFSGHFAFIVELISSSLAVEVQQLLVSCGLFSVHLEKQLLSVHMKMANKRI